MELKDGNRVGRPLKCENFTYDIPLKGERFSMPAMRYLNITYLNIFDFLIRCEEKLDKPNGFGRAWKLYAYPAKE